MSEILNTFNFVGNIVIFRDTVIPKICDDVCDYLYTLTKSDLKVKKEWK